MKVFFEHLGVDRAVSITLLGRGWNICSGVLTILAVAYFISPAAQGFYYTFNSLIALQIFAELGLNSAIVQFASHEMARLTWHTDGTLVGDAMAKRRLKSIMVFVLRWFSVVAVLMIAILLPAGLYFFSVNEQLEIKEQSVGLPWSLLVFSTAGNLFIAAIAAILEGCGKVAHVALLRLWQSIFSVAIGLITLSLGGQLFALTLSSMAMGAVGLIWIWVNYRAFLRDLLYHNAKASSMKWREEIWPFQWRIAVSWISGYFIFQLFNPLLFKTHGPILAGQMGMTLQIVGAINGAAMAWISTKVPTYGLLIARKQRQDLDALFFRGLLQSGAFLFASLIAAWIVLYYLTVTESQYAQRVLPLGLFTVLCLVSLMNHVVFAEASYLRAHRKEPFMIVSIMSGATTLILAWSWISPYGLAGAVFSYAVPTFLCGLCGGTYVFLRKREQWKSENVTI